MGWSKKTRIMVMLAIDIAFFLVELVGGIVAHSLALQADAFHMLNDIISLAIGFWAVTVASKATTDKYSYGWLRAEVIGAFFNAVFLIALCVSIILEATTRFIEPPEIKEPKLILIVGCFGLCSNLAGFFVLGGHGHSHGHDAHDHPHTNNNYSHMEEGTADGPNANGGLGEAQAQAHVAEGTSNATTAANTSANSSANILDSGPRVRFGGDATWNRDGSESRSSRVPTRSRDRSKRRSGSLRHSRLTSLDDISIYPASFRQDIIAASRAAGNASESEADDSETMAVEEEDADENSPLLGSGSNGAASIAAAPGQNNANSVHAEHHHNKPKKRADKGHGHGHSHGDMGMNAMVLHVIGDALGNIGVIITALVVWLSTWSWKDYTDPAVSLFITCIILRSALPLTFATAKILLQATPDHIDVPSIREDIETLDGVISCHHMHIWQLSDTKLVASMHMQVEFAISEEGGKRYMDLAKRARECLHEHGIHSATIQPEFYNDETHDHAVDHTGLRLDGTFQTGGAAAVTPTRACMLECVENCVGKGCCSIEGTDSGTLGSEPRSRGSHSGSDAGHSDNESHHGHHHHHHH